MEKTQETTVVTDEQLKRLADGTFILNFHLGSISTRAKVKREKVEKMAEAIREDADVESVGDIRGGDADDLKVSKELLRVPEIAALIKEMNMARTTMRNGAEPVAFLKGGLYVYSAMKVEWAQQQMKLAQERMDALVEALEPKWESILREDERRLKPLGLYDPRDYPTLRAISEKAQIRYSWFRFGVPTALEAIDKKLFEAERAKAKAMWAEMYGEIRLAYRETLQQFIEKIRAALVPGEDGKRRVLKQATLDNLTEFLNGFRLSDVTDDSELRQLIDKAKAALNGSDAEVLRTEPRAADRVAKAMTEIGEAVQALVVTQGRRVQLRD